MARELTLRMATDASPEDVRRWMLRFGAVRLTPKGDLVGDGIVGAWVQPESHIGRESVKEQFGFEPTARIIFRFDKFDRFEDGLKAALRTAMYVLANLKSDAVAFENGDDVVFVNRNGVLELSRSTDFWTDDRLQWIDSPHAGIRRGASSA